MKMKTARVRMAAAYVIALTLTLACGAAMRVALASAFVVR